MNPHLREMMLALPSAQTDLYRIHQLVWEHVARVSTKRDPEFIYRIDDGMIRVRSDSLPHMSTRACISRPNVRVHLDLAAVSGTDHQTPVPSNEIDAWSREKLQQHGFTVQTLEVVQHELRTGCKRSGGRTHAIRIPVARLEATINVANDDLASLAWRGGIGRGKRFGLGMLAH